jgi:hypothetical protein
VAASGVAAGKDAAVAPLAAASGVAQVTASAVQDSAIDRRSRAELYKIAQELDIPGRSKMSRDELAAAVKSGS